jgi:hypothetical protein
MRNYIVTDNIFYDFSSYNKETNNILFATDDNKDQIMTDNNQTSSNNTNVKDDHRLYLEDKSKDIVDRVKANN